MLNEERKGYGCIRGKLSLYVNNGTNFVDASSKIKNPSLVFQQDIVVDFITNEFIEWNFVSAQSPHFGGLWEAEVRSSKHFLKLVTK